jgi:hypothetical protein
MAPSGEKSLVVGHISGLQIDPNYNKYRDCEPKADIEASFNSDGILIKVGKDAEPGVYRVSVRYTTSA